MAQIGGATLENITVAVATAGIVVVHVVGVFVTSVEYIVVATNTDFVISTIIGVVVAVTSNLLPIIVSINLDFLIITCFVSSLLLF